MCVNLSVHAAVLSPPFREGTHLPITPWCRERRRASLRSRRGSIPARCCWCWPPAAPVGGHAARGVKHHPTDTPPQQLSGRNTSERLRQSLETSFPTGFRLLSSKTKKNLLTASFRSVNYPGWNTGIPSPHLPRRGRRRAGRRA